MFNISFKGMKRIGLFLLGCFLPLLMQAQDYNTKCLGASVGYLFETKNVQAEVFFYLPIAKRWRIAPDVQYSFSYDNVYEWGIDGNIHYLIPFAGRFTFYPLAGIAFQSWHSRWMGEEILFVTENKFGINTGVGFEVTLPYRLNLHLEGKYIFMEKFHQPHISLGLGYRF